MLFNQILTKTIWPWDINLMALLLYFTPSIDQKGQLSILETHKPVYDPLAN